MEQLQGLLSNMAVGLRRLETELNVEELEVTPPEERARKTLLRIATAANRCSWCSVCELACYIMTGGLARRTHIPISIFLSRPMYMLQKCRRFLQHGDRILLDAPDVDLDHSRGIDTFVFTAVSKVRNAPQPTASSSTQPTA